MHFYCKKKLISYFVATFSEPFLYGTQGLIIKEWHAWPLDIPYISRILTCSKFYHLCCSICYFSPSVAMFLCTCTILYKL